MPRLRDSTEPMTRLLRGYGINGNNFADVAHISPATARKKIADPSLLTIGDLDAIHRRFGIPVEEIRGNIL